MLLMLAAAAAAAHAASPTPRAIPCEPPRSVLASGVPGAPRIQRLDRMPPARQILGVFHEEDGCPKPIVVRETVGQPQAPDAPPR